MRSLTLTTLIALSAAGCASPGPRAPHGGPPSSGRPGGGSVFFSPAGEPFRSSLGEPAPMARWFAGADADHDGRLSPAEFTADHRRFFKVLDADGDGRIDGPEVGRYETVLAPEILGAADRVPERPPEGAAPGGPPEGGRRQSAIGTRLRCRLGGRKRRSCGRSGGKEWSEWQDSNLRPPAPEAGALPGCATLRALAEASYNVAAPARQGRGEGPAGRRRCGDSAKPI